MIDSPPYPPHHCPTTTAIKSKHNNEDNTKDDNSNNNTGAIPEIPVEIVGEEEMAIIEAALAAAARTSISHLSSTSSSVPLMSSQFCRNARSANTVTVFYKRGVASLSGSASIPDIEDAGGTRSSPLKKKSKEDESLLSRFRGTRGLSVTDITGSEWCEKQMEFVLLFGKRERTKAMKEGSKRHEKLEEEVLKRVEVRAKTAEDVWALKFINFIVGANQLLFEGLTRELPVMAFVQGVLVVGIIDELRIPVTETARKTMLVDTKTRGQARLPSEPQQRNGRLQLMCYKYLWDNLTADKFSSQQFFNKYDLNPQSSLSDDIKTYTANSGFPVETLDELVRYFRNACSTMPPADDQLLLRYELQGDYSLIGEDEFEYDINWLEANVKHSLEFWQGEREASYVSEVERWKCSYCQFADFCPSQRGVDSPSSSQQN